MFQPDEHVIAFGAGVPRQSRSDICALMQEADRFASRTHNRDVYWQAWMNYFDARLRKYGCERLTTITSQPLFVSDNDELDDLTLSFSTCDDAQGLVDLAQRVLATLGIHDFVEAWLATDGQGNARLGSWVVVPCNLNRHGEIVLTTFGVQLRGLPFTSQRKPEVVMRVSGGIYTFDPQAYEPFRREVRERIKGMNLRKLTQTAELFKAPGSP